MNSTFDTQAIATAELNSHLEQQIQEIAPETDPDAARIRLIKRHQVREAINEGEYFWRKKQSFPKLKDFRTWLEQQRFTWKDACRHIKLYEVFTTFPLDQISWLSLDTLYALCQPKYKELLERMQCSGVWWDTQVQELMKQVRSCVKKIKPKVELQPASGWKRMPSGGGRYYVLNLHDDKLGVLIETYSQKKNWLPSKVIEEAMLSLCQLQPLASSGRLLDERLERLSQRSSATVRTQSKNAERDHALFQTETRQINDNKLLTEDGLTLSPPTSPAPSSMKRYSY